VKFYVKSISYEKFVSRFTTKFVSRLTTIVESTFQKQICASLNHRKVIKAESSRLITRKLSANLPRVFNYFVRAFNYFPTAF